MAPDTCFKQLLDRPMVWHGDCDKVFVFLRTVALESDKDHVRNCFIGSADPDGIG